MDETIKLTRDQVKDAFKQWLRWLNDNLDALNLLQSEDDAIECCANSFARIASELQYACDNVEEQPGPTLLDLAGE